MKQFTFTLIFNHLQTRAIEAIKPTSGQPYASAVKSKFWMNYFFVHIIVQTILVLQCHYVKISDVWLQQIWAQLDTLLTFALKIRQTSQFNLLAVQDKQLRYSRVYLISHERVGQQLLLICFWFSISVTMVTNSGVHTHVLHCCQNKNWLSFTANWLSLKCTILLLTLWNENCSFPV